MNVLMNASSTQGRFLVSAVRWPNVYVAQTQISGQRATQMGQDTLFRNPYMVVECPFATSFFVFTEMTIGKT